MHDYTIRVTLRHADGFRGKIIRYAVISNSESCALRHARITAREEHPGYTLFHAAIESVDPVPVRSADLDASWAAWPMRGAL